MWAQPFSGEHSRQIPIVGSLGHMVNSLLLRRVITEECALYYFVVCIFITPMGTFFPHGKFGLLSKRKTSFEMRYPVIRKDITLVEVPQNFARTTFFICARFFSRLVSVKDYGRHWDHHPMLWLRRKWTAWTGIRTRNLWILSPVFSLVGRVTSWSLCHYCLLESYKRVEREVSDFGLKLVHPSRIETVARTRPVSPFLVHYWHLHLLTL